MAKSETAVAKHEENAAKLPQAPPLGALSRSKYLHPIFKI
jgi:hypothetical protein